MGQPLNFNILILSKSTSVNLILHHLAAQWYARSPGPCDCCRRVPVGVADQLDILSLPGLFVRGLDGDRGWSARWWLSAATLHVQHGSLRDDEVSAPGRADVGAGVAGPDLGDDQDPVPLGVPAGGQLALLLGPPDVERVLPMVLSLQATVVARCAVAAASPGPGPVAGRYS